jgi:hypothetical protein
VHDDDIARSYQPGEFVGVAPRDLVVVRPFVLAEVAAVSGVAVEPVVDPLRDLEEPRTRRPSPAR